jgi:hypothetical protein
VKSIYTTHINFKVAKKRNETNKGKENLSTCLKCSMCTFHYLFYFFFNNKITIVRIHHAMPIGFISITPELPSSSKANE